MFKVQVLQKVVKVKSQQRKLSSLLILESKTEKGQNKK